MSAPELAWRTSSFSGNGGDCVEVAWPQEVETAVRDSKNADGPALAFSATRWRSFLTTVR